MFRRHFLRPFGAKNLEVEVAILVHFSEHACWVVEEEKADGEGEVGDNSSEIRASISEGERPRSTSSKESGSAGGEKGMGSDLIAERAK